jgi:outer membrane lipoprotein-sorting protein
VLSKMDQVGKNFKSLEAAIERTKVTVLVNDKSTDKGKIYVTREGNANRMKIDFTVPSPQSVLVDKGKVLLYYPKQKQAQEYTVGQGSDKAAGFMLVGFGQSSADIKKDYEPKVLGSEVIDGKKTTMLELKPRSAKFAAQFKSIVLWLDETGWVPVQLRHNEASGDYQIAKLTGIKTNGKVSNSVFSMKLPKDVTVSKGTF